MATLGPILTRPASGRSSPSNAFSRLVFPDPFAPTIATRSPALMVNAGTFSPHPNPSPEGEGYDSVRPSL